MMIKIRKWFNHRKEHGYTMGELLITVVVLAAMLAYASVEYKWVVEKIKATEGVILLKSFYEAQKAYYQRYGMYCFADFASPITTQCPGFEAELTNNFSWTVEGNNFYFNQLTCGTKGPLGECHGSNFPYVRPCPASCGGTGGAGKGYLASVTRANYEGGVVDALYDFEIFEDGSIGCETAFLAGDCCLEICEKIGDYKW